MSPSNTQKTMHSHSFLRNIPRDIPRNILSRQQPHILRSLKAFKLLKQILVRGSTGGLAILFLLGIASQIASGKTLDEHLFEQILKETSVPLAQQSAPAVRRTFIGQYRTISPDRQTMVMYDATEGRSRLYQLDGTETASVEGEFQAFTPDGKGLITYADGQSRLYDINGIEQATFQGAPLSFTPDHQSLFVVDDFSGFFRMMWGQFPLRLYDLNGTEKATFEGVFKGFTPDGQKVIVEHSGETCFVTTLYDLGGREPITLLGNFVSLTPDDQGLITTDYNQSRLYQLDGTFKALLKGRFRESLPSGLRIGLADIDYSNGFTPDGQGIVTSDGDRTWLYDQNGTFQRTFPGDFLNFTPDGQGIITYDFGKQSWLYSRTGTLQQTFEGKLVDFTPNGKSVVVQSSYQSQLYTLDGVLQATFAGPFLAFSPNDTGLITNGSGADGYYSWLYPLAFSDSLEREDPIKLEGLLVGFVSHGRGMITSSDGIYGSYRLYHADGSLQIPSQTWPRATPDGQGIVVSMDDQSHLYDFFGKKKETFLGVFQTFTADNQGLITYSEADNQSWLYPLEGIL